MLVNSTIENTHIRELIIKVAAESGEAAHIGGSLSMVEMMNTLFGKELRHKPSDPMWPDRDIFILSKGHCVLGYFSVLHAYGYFDSEKLSTFQQNGSDLIAHPVKNLPLGIESSNGSLGQGLSYGLGLAIAMRKKAEVARRVFVMMGDGECNEGSVWEAAALAAELKLSNVVAMVDNNGFRNDGINNSHRNGDDSALAGIWRAFGWRVVEVDGHNVAEIESAFEEINKECVKPSVIIANTVKGKGFDFMENNNDWHHNRITASIYEKCIAQLLTSDGATSGN